MICGDSTATTGTVGFTVCTGLACTGGFGAGDTIIGLTITGATALAGCGEQLPRIKATKIDITIIAIGFDLINFNINLSQNNIVGSNT